MEVIAVDRGIKLILDSTDEVKCLYQRVGGSGTKTLHDGANNNYQIPVGKKYIGNYIYVQAPEGGNSEFILHDSASVDSATGTKLIGDGFRLLNSASTVCEFPVFFEVAAGRYINYQEADAGSSSITLIGVLTNA
jgi:hypothetical protein